MKAPALCSGIGLAAAVLALGALRLGYGAVGVVLDTPPVAAALALIALALASFALRRRRNPRLLSLGGAAGMTAVAIAVLTAAWPQVDLYRVGRAERVSFASGDVTLSPVPGRVPVHDGGLDSEPGAVGEPWGLTR